MYCEALIYQMSMSATSIGNLSTLRNSMIERKVEMSKTKVRVVNSLLVCCVAFMLVFLGVERGYGESVNIAPHRIILNAKCEGAEQDIQAIISIVLSSSRITDFEVTLWLGDIEIVKAQGLRYCIIDYNLLASFDRQVIQDHPDVINQANQGSVKFTVDGWVTVSDSDGGTMTTEFNGNDLVEILAPGKQK